MSAIRMLFSFILTCTCVSANLRCEDRMASHMSRAIAIYYCTLLRLFHDFVLTYDRTYATKEEYRKRFRIFCDDLNDIVFASTTDMNKTFYTVDDFSDRSVEEFEYHVPHNELVYLYNETKFGE